MGQVLHGSATTTEAVRRAIQNNQESVRALAKRYSINRKTVSKWKHRETVADRKTGSKEARSTVLTPEEEVVAVAFRRNTLLPLDDCLYDLKSTIPHLTRSSFRRLFNIVGARLFSSWAYLKCWFIILCTSIRHEPQPVPAPVASQTVCKAAPVFLLMKREISLRPTFMQAQSMGPLSSPASAGRPARISSGLTSLPNCCCNHSRDAATGLSLAKNANVSRPSSSPMQRYCEGFDPYTELVVSVS